LQIYRLILSTFLIIEAIGTIAACRAPLAATKARTVLLLASITGAVTTYVGAPSDFFKFAPFSKGLLVRSCIQAVRALAHRWITVLAVKEADAVSFRTSVTRASALQYNVWAAVTFDSEYRLFK
jgi:hypothetical protein